ncbi:MAG: DUF3618 domain-containing protein, partial [Sphingomonadales bacterium]|nr:DUF3618 domain-containing protein [Sphingomonadales bacterium]
MRHGADHRRDPRRSRQGQARTADAEAVSDPTELDRAEARAAEARLRMTETLTELQTRLDPRNVAREAVDGLTDT